MTSTINRAIPVQLSLPVSAEMRAQFGAAADDIELLQSGKQATLVSASNIKTINGLSIVGAGDLVVSGGGGGGTVTSISVTAANGVSGTVATASTTPAITLALGAITPTSVVASGTVTGSNLSNTNTGDNAINSQYSGLVSNATHTGDATGATALTLATVNANVGTFGSGTLIPVVTTNAKGLITAISTVAVTSGGSGDMVLASAQTNTGAKTYNAATLLLRNVANTISSLFTNAATVARTWTLPDKDGTVAMTSDIVVTGLTGPITSTGNATAVAAQTGTGTTFVMQASPTLTTPNLGTPSAGVLTNATGTAAGLTAGTVTTNANLTGEVTSTGNAATLTNSAVIGKVITGYVSGAGVVAATDSILAVLQKLNGNDASRAPQGLITASGLTQSTARLLGRSTAATGAIEEIILGTNLSFTGTTLNAAGGGGSGLPTDGSGTMTGAIATTVGTLTSSVANGAAAKGFTLNTPSYTTAGAKLLAVQNNAVEKASIDKDGYFESTKNGTLAYGINVGAVKIGIGRNSGTGGLNLHGTTDSADGAASANLTDTALMLQSGVIIKWASSANVNVAADIGMVRNAAGVTEVNNGTAGVFRDLRLRNLIVSAGVIATDAAAPTLASAATIAPVTSIAFVSGVVAINTITAPSPISAGGGQITLIPTGLFSTTTAGNIALATTAVVSRALILSYDVTSGKWYPSY